MAVNSTLGWLNIYNCLRELHNKGKSRMGVEMLSTSQISTIV